MPRDSNGHETSLFPETARKAASNPFGAAGGTLALSALGLFLGDQGFDLRNTETIKALNERVDGIKQTHALQIEQMHQTQNAQVTQLVDTYRAQIDLLKDELEHSKQTVRDMLCKTENICLDEDL